MQSLVELERESAPVQGTAALCSVFGDEQESFPTAFLPLCLSELEPDHLVAVDTDSSSDHGENSGGESVHVEELNNSRKRKQSNRNKSSIWRIFFRNRKGRCPPLPASITEDKKWEIPSNSNGPIKFTSELEASH